MDRKRRTLRLAVAAVLLEAVVAPTAGAQGTTATGLEEIIVSATKRNESAQDVPISITAFSAADMEKIGVAGIQDIALRTPGLKWGNRSDLKLNPTVLRGIGSQTGGSAGAEDAVSYYMDEIYLGSGVSSNIDLYDLERVEVLRGPQGTLFGRNSIGGAISMTSRKPTREFSAYTSLEGGNYDLVRAKASIGGPLGAASFSGLLSGAYLDRSGYTENDFRNESGDDANSAGLRGQLRWQSERADFNLSAEYREVDQHSKFFETLRYNPDAVLVQVMPLFDAPVNDDPYDREVAANGTGKETLESSSVALHGVVSLTGFDFTTITSYREHEYANIGDTDMTTIDWIYDGDPEDVSRLSQEFRLTSTGDGPFNWIAGLYYLHQETDNLSFVTLSSDLLTLLEIPVDSIQSGSSAQLDLDSYAAYASLGWRPTDAWELTFGGRYTYEEKSIDYVQDDPLDLLGGTFAVQADDSWSKFTPSFSARFHANDDVMLYGAVGQGFKSGGFNDALGEGTGISFDPESLWNYELGIKTNLIERRLQANAAVYLMDWSDIQIRQDNPATPAVYDPITTNAGSAHSQGIEVELLYLATDRLTFELAGTVLEAEYDEGVDASGQPLRDLPGAPDNMLNFAAEYRIPLSGGSELALRGELLHQGDIEYSPTADPVAHVDPAELYNARLAWTSADDRWTVAAWGRNLTDEAVVERVFDLYDNPFAGQTFIVLNPPRTYGLELRYDFR
jgi:iron complex outermembrane receptor protein